VSEWTETEERTMKEEEQNELLEAALKLADYCKDLELASPAQLLSSLVANVEKHRPAPPFVEGWVNEYHNGAISFRSSKSAAIEEGSAGEKPTRNAVHVREVLPWKEWRGDGQNLLCGDTYLLTTWNSDESRRIAEFHNAEMERIAGAKGEV